MFFSELVLTEKPGDWNVAADNEPCQHEATSSRLGRLPIKSQTFIYSYLKKGFLRECAAQFYTSKVPVQLLNENHLCVPALLSFRCYN